MVVAEIAVIGGGASGLVTSRHLLRNGFRAQIFEKSSVLGGLWHTSSKEILSWNRLNTNLSKFTCCFSEFPWEEEGEEVFPSREQMQRYLTGYERKFLKDGCRFRYNCRVTNVEREGEGFKVEWRHTSTEESSSDYFDGVVITTGFFSEPFLPEDVDYTAFGGKHLHSSRYRNADEFKDKTVAVVGASFSALELAADLASTAKHVVNIVPKVPYVLPRYLPLQPDSVCTPFLPADLVLYRRKTLPQEETLTLDAEGCRAKHEGIRSVVGKTMQSGLGFPGDTTSPPFVSISDTYLNYVNMGKIQVVQDRLSGFQSPDTLVLSSGTTIPSIDSVISCTGYKTNLSFLSPDILDTVQYDPKDRFAPLVLCHDIYYPSIPKLGFVGVYRGVYFGVMELQARFLSDHFARSNQNNEEKEAELLKTSLSIRNTEPRPQFPHPDYIGLMDHYAQELDLLPEPEFAGEGAFIAPALYQPDRNLARKAYRSIELEVEQSKQGRNIPVVLMNALVGKWSFFRRISYIPTEERGYGEKKTDETVLGDILYTPQKDCLLYREDGIYSTPTKTFDIFREYEYVLNPSSHSLEIYFVENQKRAGLFLSLVFEPTEEGWVATSDHLCINDLYQGTFLVKFDGIAVTYVRMQYRVKGPKKDYCAVTELRPKISKTL